MENYLNFVGSQKVHTSTLSPIHIYKVFNYPKLSLDNLVRDVGGATLVSFSSFFILFFTFSLVSSTRVS
jgi:hypothetical protein